MKDQRTHHRTLLSWLDRCDRRFGFWRRSPIKSVSNSSPPLSTSACQRIDDRGRRQLVDSAGTDEPSPGRSCSPAILRRSAAGRRTRPLPIPPGYPARLPPRAAMVPAVSPASADGASIRAATISNGRSGCAIEPLVPGSEGGREIAIGWLGNRQCRFDATVASRRRSERFEPRHAIVPSAAASSISSAAASSAKRRNVGKLGDCRRRRAGKRPPRDALDRPARCRAHFLITASGWQSNWRMPGPQRPAHRHVARRARQGNQQILARIAATGDRHAANPHHVGVGRARCIRGHCSIRKERGRSHAQSGSPARPDWQPTAARPGNGKNSGTESCRERNSDRSRPIRCCDHGAGKAWISPQHYPARRSNFYAPSKPQIDPPPASLDRGIGFNDARRRLRLQ